MGMTIWTVQRKKVVDFISEEGFYQPDIRKSTYVQKNPKLESFYSAIVKNFNNINYTNLPGVIFGFIGFQYDKMFEIPNVETFYKIILDNRIPVKSLWENFLKDEYYLLELHIEMPFMNPLCIEFNDFQFIMPPFVELFPYTKEDFDRIISNFEKGTIGAPVLPSNLVQVHLPYIHREHIKGIYNVLDFDEIENFIKANEMFCSEKNL